MEKQIDVKALRVYAVLEHIGYFFWEHSMQMATTLTF